MKQIIFLGFVLFSLLAVAQKSEKYTISGYVSDVKSGEALIGVKIFIPELKIPNLTKSKKVKGQVIKYLHDNLLLDDDIGKLTKDKVWKKS